jgi:ubiquinol-cytochrome c reductase iron-sulfur subunit
MSTLTHDKGPEGDIKSHNAEAHDASHLTRRNFIHIATASFLGIGAAAALWPAIDQMNPDAGALSLATIEVDLAPIAEGQAITVMWRGKPVFIRNRTAVEIEQARGVPVEQLPDPDARVLNVSGVLPATDENRTKSGHENWLVMIGICTHLGCIPKGQGPADSKGQFGGWFCPCHGSHYDTAGRIRLGPAPRNLDVPPYEFVADTRIRIG